MKVDWICPYHHTPTKIRLRFCSDSQRVNWVHEDGTISSSGCTKDQWLRSYEKQGREPPPLQDPDLMLAEGL